MKSIFAAISGMVVLGSVSVSALDIGDAFPKMDASISQVKAVDGKTINLNTHRGSEGTLVIFSCNHCPFVKMWEDRSRDLGNKYANKLAVIQINSNDAEAYPEDNFENMKIRAKEKSFSFPYAMDSTSKVATAFGATKTPEFFLFGKDGKLAYKGALDDNQKADKVKINFLANAIEALMAGKKIDPSKTNSVGCGIKFRS